MNKQILLGIFGGIVVLGLAYGFAFRPWMLFWGTTPAERQMTLPGDGLAPNVTSGFTQAVTIRATPAQIWPWLLQIGQGRGGLYSYDWLENLVGCDIHNADSILPQFQELKVGDVIRFGPGNFPYNVVLAIDPQHALVLGADPKIVKDGSVQTWAMLLSPQADGSTRLIARLQSNAAPTTGNNIGNAILNSISSVMNQKMLTGIRERAERK